MIDGTQNTWTAPQLLYLHHRQTWQSDEARARRAPPSLIIIVLHRSSVLPTLLYNDIHIAQLQIATTKCPRVEKKSDLLSPLPIPLLSKPGPVIATADSTGTATDLRRQ